jgi:hypothetical protein
MVIGRGRRLPASRRIVTMLRPREQFGLAGWPLGLLLLAVAERLFVAGRVAQRAVRLVLVSALGLLLGRALRGRHRGALVAF